MDGEEVGNTSQRHVLHIPPNKSPIRSGLDRGFPSVQPRPPGIGIETSSSSYDETLSARIVFTDHGAAWKCDPGMFPSE